MEAQSSVRERGRRGGRHHPTPDMGAGWVGDRGGGMVLLAEEFGAGTSGGSSSCAKARRGAFGMGQGLLRGHRRQLHGGRTVHGRGGFSTVAGTLDDGRIENSGRHPGCRSAGHRQDALWRGRWRARRTRRSFTLRRRSSWRCLSASAQRVRDTFEKALAQQPAVVFIDRLDAIGRRRGSGTGIIHEEREQTLNCS